MVQRLRQPLTELGARERFKSLLTNNPKLKEVYLKYLKDYQEIKSTYSTVHYRGFAPRKRA